MQTTQYLLMIKPVAFGLNIETAHSNAFQNKESSQHGVQNLALAEFNNLVTLLKENNMDVMVIEDTFSPHTPDSIFPNNWVSFHEDGTVFLYPMEAKNRRLERREDIIEQIAQSFKLSQTIDLSYFENQNLFLEGTGSMVLDRENKIAYACLSSRTNEMVLKDFCEKSGYQTCYFHSFDKHQQAIYHTNVMMCMGDNFVVIGLDTITDEKEKEILLASFKKTNKEVILLSNNQIENFAGNMLLVKNTEQVPHLIMSNRAFHSLSEVQKNQLSKHAKLLNAPLTTIEENGGGSARCMIAEIHLPKK